MSTTITASLPSGTTETVEVDLVVAETFGNKATITDHPVESGSNMSDHIRPEAEVDHFDLVFTNTPFGAGAKVEADASGALIGIEVGTANFPGTRAEQAYAMLVRWQTLGALLALDTTLGPRDSMAVENVGAVRDAKTGGKPGHTGAVRVSLALKQIRIVRNKLTTISVSRNPRVAGKVKTGEQPTTPTSPEVESKLNVVVDQVSDSLTSGALKPFGHALGVD